MYGGLFKRRNSCASQCFPGRGGYMWIDCRNRDLGHAIADGGDIEKDVNNLGGENVLPWVIGDSVARGEYYFDVIKDAGADLRRVDEFGITPLAYASWRSYSKKKFSSFLQFLSMTKGDVNVADKDGVTPLMRASNVGFTNVISVLIEVGAKVDVADKDGQTALYAAVRAEKWDNVSLLLKCGADPNNMPVNIYAKWSLQKLEDAELLSRFQDYISRCNNPPTVASSSK